MDGTRRCGGPVPKSHASFADYGGGSFVYVACRDHFHSATGAFVIFLEPFQNTILVEQMGAILGRYDCISFLCVGSRKTK